MIQLELAKQYCPFICEALKSRMEWSNVQHASALTTTILLTTAGTFHGLNYFGHVVYALQTTTYYQNIAKLLTHPSIYKDKVKYL